MRDALRDVVASRIDRSEPLAALRRLGTYAIAADLIDLQNYDPGFDRTFRRWLEDVRQVQFSGGGGGTIADDHERRPNNWGTHAGATRMAVALYSCRP